MGITECCGIVALEQFSKERGVESKEVSLNANVFLLVAESMGYDFTAVRISRDEWEDVSLPVIALQDEHYFVVNSFPDLIELKSDAVIFTTEPHIGKKLTYKELKDLKGSKGGGGTTVVQSSSPSQPSTADAIREWVNSLPQIYQAQLDYAPKEAAQQVALAQEYAQPYGEALKTAQEALYPGTTAIQENLANQVLGGMSDAPPSWMKDQYLSDLRANLGTNAGSGVGADYTSRGLLQMNKDWGDYYRNLGLSVTGRQPLTQAATPATSNYMSNFSPTSVMGYTSQNYGTYAPLNATRTQNYKPGWLDWGNAAGSMLQGIGSMF